MLSLRCPFGSTLPALTDPALLPTVFTPGSECAGAQKCGTGLSSPAAGEGRGDPGTGIQPLGVGCVRKRAGEGWRGGVCKVRVKAEKEPQLSLRVLTVECDLSCCMFHVNLKTAKQTLGTGWGSLRFSSKNFSGETWKCRMAAGRSFVLVVVTG